MVSLEKNDIHIEKRLLGLAIAKKDCLMKWIEDVADRFVSYDPDMAEKLQEYARQVGKSKQKMQSRYFSLFAEAGLPVNEDDHGIYEEYENRFVEEDHYLVVDAVMASRLLKNLVEVADDAELFCRHCSKQSLLYRCRQLYVDIASTLRDLKDKLSELFIPYRNYDPFLTRQKYYGMFFS